MPTYLKLALLSVFFVVSVFGQANKKLESLLFVPVPSDVILPVIAVQPDSPLHFENVGHFAGIKGGAFTSFDLRNISSKSIRRFKVASSDGTETEWWKDSGAVVRPGERVPQSNNPNIKTVQLTPKIQSDLKFDGPMRGIVVLMIVSVEFDDGTKFQDQETYEKLNSFLELVNNRIYREKQQK